MEAPQYSASTVFEVNDLTYRYGGERNAALENVRVSIPRGESVAILGLSGSGKSTLLAILGRLIESSLPPQAVVFHSQDLARPVDYAQLDKRASNDLRRDSFGFIMQSANMLANFTCRTNIEMPLMLQGVPPRERDARLQLLIDRLRSIYEKSECEKLLQRLDSLPSELSTGQRQRMAVLRALIHDPEVVFADEPCNSLDPYNAEQFRELLGAWQAESRHRRTLILVTHNAHEACRVASRIAVVDRHGVGHLPILAKSEYAGAEDIEARILAYGGENVA